jgi:hypothetical protein
VYANIRSRSGGVDNRWCAVAVAPTADPNTYFYSEEHDLRGKLGDIDTARCPVVIMAAEYGYCTTPEDAPAPPPRSQAPCSEPSPASATSP